MNRVERLFAISEVIRGAGRQPVSAGRLAERFDVSRRTIERDLASLRAAGAPLVGEPGRNGGVVRLDAAAGAVVALSTTQVTALLMATSVAGRDMPYSADAEAGAQILLDALATNTRDTVTELRNRVRTSVEHPVVGARIRRTLEEAVRRGVVVNIDYVDGGGASTSRGVDAVGFYRGTDGWFLIGWCNLRNGGRIFRLDRIERAHMTSRPILERDVDEVLGWVPSATLAP